MSILRSCSRFRWLFWLHAGILLLLAASLLVLHLLMRNLLISTFAALFVLMVTGFFLILSGLVDFGASVEALLDKEAHAWLWVVLSAAVIFAGVIIFLSPQLSIQRLLDFAVVHALALGFLETRLANRLRHHPIARTRLLGFGRLSIVFVVLLLMGTLYGSRYSVLVLAAYCLVVAAELIFLPRPIHDHQHPHTLSENMAHHPSAK